MIRPPNGYTEQEVLNIIDAILDKLAYKFQFSCHAEKDLRQQAYLDILKNNILDKYDGRVKLENFLYVHIKNRFINFKRDNYIKKRPCLKCPLSAYLPPDGCSAFTDKMECAEYAFWKKKNEFKRNINNTLEYSIVNADNEHNMQYSRRVENDIDTKELLDIIDKEMPTDLRKYYLMMLYGERVSKKNKEEVKAFILQLLKDHGKEY